jgi:hypothetical protein
MGAVASTLMMVMGEAHQLHLISSSNYSIGSTVHLASPKAIAQAIIKIDRATRQAEKVDKANNSKHLSNLSNHWMTKT